MDSPLKTQRLQWGLTQAQVALLLGVTTAAVGQWELGDLVLSTARVRQLADMFGVPEERLAEDLAAFRAEYQRKQAQARKRLAQRLREAVTAA